MVSPLLRSFPMLLAAPASHSPLLGRPRDLHTLGSPHLPHGPGGQNLPPPIAPPLIPQPPSQQQDLQSRLFCPVIPPWSFLPVPGAALCSWSPAANGWPSQLSSRVRMLTSHFDYARQLPGTCHPQVQVHTFNMRSFGATCELAPCPSPTLRSSQNPELSIHPGAHCPVSPPLAYSCLAQQCHCSCIGLRYFPQAWALPGSDGDKGFHGSWDGGANPPKSLSTPNSTTSLILSTPSRQEHNSLIALQRPGKRLGC